MRWLILLAVAVGTLMLLAPHASGQAPTPSYVTTQQYRQDQDIQQSQQELQTRYQQQQAQDQELQDFQRQYGR